MSYEIHIEESGKSLEEWVTFVEKNPELELVHEAVSKNPETGEEIRISTPNTGVSRISLRYSPSTVNGNLVITVYGPRQEDIASIKSVDMSFGGKVVGDEGEEY